MAYASNFPADAILANGAGNYAGWLHRFYLYRAYPTLLGPTSGAMGYGVPAAVAAKILHPERTVIACAGDGCFLMNGQELATAVQYDAAIIVLVFDNGMYGTIRMHQEREYPGHVIGTNLRNPDFAALARSYGALGFSRRRAPTISRMLSTTRSKSKKPVAHPHQRRSGSDFAHYDADEVERGEEIADLRASRSPRTWRHDADKPNSRPVRPRAHRRSRRPFAH